jgi:hypothetical protein
MITIAFDIPTSIETVNDIPDLVHVGLTFLTQLDWLLCAAGKMWCSHLKWDLVGLMFLTGGHGKSKIKCTNAIVKMDRLPDPPGLDAACTSQQPREFKGLGLLMWTRQCTKGWGPDPAHRDQLHPFYATHTACGNIAQDQDPEEERWRAWQNDPQNDRFSRRSPRCSPQILNWLT